MTQDEAIARESIRKTINAYTIAGDSRNGSSFYPLFAEDAVLAFAGYPPLPGFRCNGREEIRERTATWSDAHGKEPALSRTSFIRHNLTTCQILLTGPDSATARTYFIVFTEIGPDHMGVYSDDLIREGDGWLFQNRQVALNWRSPDSLFPPV